MGALSRLIAKELSSALGIADNPKYNPAFKDKSKTNMRPLQTLEDEQDFGDDLGQYIPDDDDMPNFWEIDPPDDVEYLDPGDDAFATTSYSCLLYTSPSPRDKRQSRMPSSA